MKQLTVDKNGANQRADKFILKAFPSLPPPLLYKAFRKKDVKLDGRRIRESDFLPEGGVLSIYLPDDCFSKKAFVPVRGEIDVVYEDENIAILDKPPGVPSQGGAGANLCDIFKTYLYNKKQFDPEREQSFSPALCNRLDTNTAGLVIGAKNAAALREMNEEIRARRVKKFYLCLTEGSPPEEYGTVELPLSKDNASNKVFISQDGKKTLTRYRVLERTPHGAKCEVELLTGRTHQIRFVMKYLGCPLVGDKKYGASQSGGQKLVAYKLSFELSSPLLSYLNGKTFYSHYTF